MNDSEKKIMKNIEEHGCHVTSVFDPEGEEPTFSYSTGIVKTYDAPELIIIGLEHSLAHSLINQYADRLAEGEAFECGQYYKGFLDGFEVTLSPVGEAGKSEYMLSSCWLYDGSDFAAYQLIYPTTSGVWPWEEEASESFIKLQPSIEEPPKW